MPSEPDKAKRWRPRPWHSCPGCGTNRNSQRAPCDECGWPNKSNPTSALLDHQRTPRRIQFHLRSLFICVSIACVVFAIVGRFGIDGFVERLELAFLVALPFLPLIEFYYWWKQNDMDKM